LARGRAVISVALATLAFLGSAGAHAADYFAGKTIRLVVGFGPASAYAIYGQLAVQHLGRFIPGNPNVVIAYMPGAAGITAMNYLYEVAPPDGSVMAVATQDLASQQALGVKGVRYDAAKFNYLGRATANVPVHMVWHTAPAKSVSDLKIHEVITGASGAIGTQIDLPRAMNALIGTKWKIISGYQDNTRAIALERGEIQAAVAAATLFSDQFKPWLDSRMVKVIVQYADFRHPTFPDVPSIMEVAETKEAKDIFKFLVSLAAVGRGYVAPPGVSVETVSLLRQAFQAMLNDPSFKADAEKRSADLLPMSGEELAAHIRETVATPSEIIKKTNEVISAK